MIGLAVGFALRSFLTMWLKDRFVTALATLMLVPMVNWLLTVVADQLFDMLIGSLDNPPWVFFRAMLMNYYRCSSSNHVDLFLILGTELVPLTWAIINAIRSGLDVFSFLNRYMEGGCIWAIFLAAFRLAVRMLDWTMEREHHLVTLALADRLRKYPLGSHLALGSFNCKVPHQTRSGESGSSSDTDDSIEDSTLLEKAEKEAEVMHQIVSDGTERSKAWGRVDTRVGLQSTSLRMMLHKTPFKDRNLPMACAFFVLHLVMLTLVALMHSQSNSIPSLLCCLVGVAFSMVLLSMAMHRVFPGFLGIMYHVLVGLFVVVAMILLVVALSYTSFSGEEVQNKLIRVILEPPANVTQYAGRGMTGYPICLMRWGSPNSEERLQLTAIDLIVLSSAIYDTYTEDIMQVVNNATFGTDLAGVELEYLHDAHTVGRWGVFKFPASKLRVLAIRGTRTLKDILVDLDLFAVIKTLQIFDNMMPILSVFSTIAVQKVLDRFGVSLKHKETDVWDPVVNAAMEWKNRSAAEGYSLILTGHSLGGLLAAIVGARLQLPALAISPPGQLYSTHKFGIRQPDIEKTLTVIQPLHDLVPKVDKQPGLVQHIECKGGYLECHSETLTACTIFRSCGDPRGRRMREDKCLVGDQIREYQESLKRQKMNDDM